MHGLAARCLLKEHVRLLPDMGGIEGVRLLVGEFQKPVRTALLLTVVHHVGNGKCRRTGTLGIREDMELGHRQGFEETVTVLEILRTLAP